MQILITGGAGFIGSHLARRFLDEGARVRVLDNFRSGHAANLQGLDAEVIKGSVTEPAMVAAAMQGVDYVFHFAAMISVIESIEHPQECAAINTGGTGNVLEAAAEAGVKKLVFASSSAIYGEDPTLPKVEEMAAAPLSPYASTKFEGEELCRRFSDEGRLPTAVLRYFNVFGPRQDPQSPYAAAIPIFTARATANEDITIFGDGQQTRDFVSVQDVVAANRLAMEQDIGTCNVGTGRPLTVHAVVEQVIALTGSRSKVVYAAAREGEIRDSYADISRIASFGFKPADPMQAIEETVRFYSQGG